MTQFDTRQSGGRGLRYRAIAAAIGGAMLIGGGAFAAVGGPQAIKQWFVTVKLVGEDGVEWEGVLEPIDDDGMATLDFATADGQVGGIQVRRIAAGELGVDGELADEELTMVQITLDKGDQQLITPTLLARDGQTATMTLDEIDGPMFSISIATASADPFDRNRAVTVKLQGADDASGLAEQLALAMAAAKGNRGTTSAIPTEAIAAAVDVSDPVETWIDANGQSAALYVIADPQGADGPEGWFAFVVRGDEDGERSFDLVGSMLGVDTAATFLANVRWVDGNGDVSEVATLSFSGDDGRLIELKVDTSDRPLVEIEEAAKPERVQLRKVRSSDR